MKRWLIKTADVYKVVEAASQYEAWDALRDLPAEDFGLVATAEADESGENYPIRTSILMFRWGRNEDAKRFIARMMQEGMSDTEKTDRVAARSSLKRI